MELKVKEPVERVGRRLKPRAIVAVLGSIVLLGAMVFLDGGEKAAAKEEIKPPPPVIPAGPVTSLPSTYERMKEEPEIPVPIVREAPLGEEGDPDLLKLQKTELINKARRAFQARLADVFVPVRGDIGGRGSAVPSGSVNDGGVDVNFGALSPQAGAQGVAAANPRDEDNRQDDKRAFLDDPRAADEVLTSRLSSPKSRYQVMAGTTIPAVLITGINSDLPGQILGQVSQSAYDTVTGDYLLIPQGTKVVGEYDSRIVYGQERVLIVWTRLIFPNGKSLSLEGMPGVDMTGYAGLSDKVNNHYLKLLSGVVVSSVLSAGSRVAQGGSRTVDPSLGQLGAEGFAMNVDQVGQQIARKNLNIQPTIEIEPGKRFSIFVNKDLVLEPYR